MHEVILSSEGTVISLCDLAKSGIHLLRVKRMSTLLISIPRRVNDCLSHIILEGLKLLQDLILIILMLVVVIRKNHG
jgi:hypothetical protein